MTNATDIETEAMQWLVRLDALDAEGAGAAAVRAQFNAWCEADTRRHAAYIRLSAAWGKTDRLSRLAAGSEVDLDILAPAARPSRRAVVRRWPLALAATVLLAVSAAWLASAVFSGQIHATGIGGFERLLLADGSTVELDTDTRIRVRFTGGRRHIELLRGQANFKVARDTRRPFEVGVAATTVRALGTVFSVRLRERRQVEVRVTEGRVAIAAPEAGRDLDQDLATPGAVPTLSAGESALIRPARLSVQPVAVQSATLARQLSWTQGRLTFEGETLEQAVAELNRYNRRQLVIADPAIAGIRVGGSFQPTDPQSFITALERSFGVAVASADEEEVRLVRAR